MADHEEGKSHNNPVKLIKRAYDFEIKFDEETFRKFKTFTNRIELIEKLKAKASILSNKYGHLVDTTLNFMLNEEDRIKKQHNRQ